MDKDNHREDHQLLKEREIIRLHKQAAQGLSQFYATEDGKAFFKLMKCLYIDPTCFDESDTKFKANVARKELVEDLFRRATGQSIIDATELDNE